MVPGMSDTYRNHAKHEPERIRRQVLSGRAVPLNSDARVQRCPADGTWTWDDDPCTTCGLSASEYLDGGA